MSSRLPVKTSTAKKGVARGPVSRKPRNNWERKRTDYAALEAAKSFVGTLLYKHYTYKKGTEYKKEIRASVLPWSKSGYVDVRIYINGRSTGQGILCHIHRWPELKAMLLDLDGEIQRLIDLGIIDPNTSEPTKFGSKARKDDPSMP